MDAMDRLSEHLKTRTAELRKLKESGKKIVGYSPGGYMPEDLVYASGAIPVCLVRGGDPEPVTESLAYIPRFIDTFCRSQIGYRMMGTEPLYLLPDLIVVPITDNNHVCRQFIAPRLYPDDLASFPDEVISLKAGSHNGPGLLNLAGKPAVELGAENGKAVIWRLAEPGGGKFNRQTVLSGEQRKALASNRPLYRCLLPEIG